MLIINIMDKLSEKQKQLLSIMQKLENSPQQMAYLIMTQYDGRVEKFEDAYDFKMIVSYRNEVIKHIIPKTIR